MTQSVGRGGAAVTRQDLIYKWLVYALALIPVWFLETLVLNRITVFGVIPMLLPMAAAIVAALEGPVPGAAYGLAVGILCDVIYFGSNGAMTLMLTLVGGIVGIAAQYGLNQNFFGCLVCCAGSLAGIDLLRILQHLFNHTHRPFPMIKVAVLEIVCSLLFAPLVYAIYRAVYRRVGGTTLM